MNRRSGHRAALLAALLLIGAVPAVLAGSRAAALSPGQTTVVSTGAQGADPSGAASSPAISADGSQIAFESRAVLDPVVQADDSAPDNIPYNVYVRDRRVAGHTVLISRGLPIRSLASRGFSVPLRATAALETGGDGDSLHPSISADGRYVAFDSVATNLRDDFGRAVQRVVVCDRDPDNDGVFDELRPDGVMDFGYLYLGPAPLGADVWGGSDPSLSAAGTAIAWLEQLPDTTSSRVAVSRLVLDAQGHPLAPDPETFRHPAASGSVGPPQLSADGTQAAFAAGSCPALAPGDCPQPIGTIQVFDVAAQRTTRLDYLPDGSLSGTATSPAISGSGRILAYQAIYGEGGTVVTVVVDRDPDRAGPLGPAPGVPVAATIASRDTSGLPEEGTSPTLSTDGRYLAFVSSAAGMHNDAQGFERTAVVLRDLIQDGARERAGLPRLPGELGSPAAEPCAAEVCPAIGPSAAPDLSADGSVLVFTSAGDDVVAPACCAGAVFARVFQPRATGAETTFGAVQVGGSTSRTVLVEHSGFGPFTITSVRVDGDGAFRTSAAENCAGTTLHADEVCNLTVGFSPTTTGTKNAVLRIAQGDGTVAEIPLQGTAEAAPPETAPVPSGGLVVTPDPLDFGGDRPALVPSDARAVEIRNGATIPITVSTVTILTGPRFVPGDFTVVATTCSGRHLAPGDTCSAQVRTTPQRPGGRSGVLAVTAADPAYTRLITLSSQARQPVLTVNPAVVRTHRVTQVIGRDLPPGHAVTITAAVPGSQPHAAAVTGPDGRLSVPLLVLPRTSAGTWPIIATVDGTAIRTQTTILIVPGSFQPPDFTSRR